MSVIVKVQELNSLAHYQMQSNSTYRDYSEKDELRIAQLRIFHRSSMISAAARTPYNRATPKDQNSERWKTTRPTPINQPRTQPNRTPNRRKFAERVHGIDIADCCRSGDLNSVPAASGWSGVRFTGSGNRQRNI